MTPLVVDLAPDADVLKLMREPRARRDAAAFRQALRERMPQRLAGHLAEAGAPEGWSNAALEACERRLHGWAFHPVGTEGFEKAEVTAGGVDTDGLQSRTMEARTVPGLFFIGEAVDVTGWLGGFNFQWAWASAVAAGRSGVRFILTDASLEGEIIVQRFGCMFASGCEIESNRAGEEVYLA